MFRQLTKVNAYTKTASLQTPTRFFSLSKSAFQQTGAPEEALPSTPEMKASSWTSAFGNNENSLTRKVVGITKKLSESGKPPIVVDKQFSKQFRAGTIYDPFDFSMSRVDMEKKWDRNNKDAYSKYQGGANDIFVKTGIDPLDLYTMPEILSKFVSATGQVLPREVTGCNAKNQRKLGIAVKRAIALGLMSSTNKHSRFMPKRIL